MLLATVDRISVVILTAPVVEKLFQLHVNFEPHLEMTTLLEIS
jgi:hypothetical protein